MLVDSCCSKSIVTKRVIDKQGRIGKSQTSVVAVDGSSVMAIGCWSAELVVAGRKFVLECLVLDAIAGGEVFILGMDAISQLGGVTVASNSSVRFGCEDVSHAAVVTALSDEKVIEIDDQDFHAEFRDDRWTVRWRWDGEEPLLTNQIPMFKIKAEAEAGFEAEVTDWIERGWLLPYDGPHDGIVPLLAVIQRNKDKVRPVMDYREVNQYVSSHTGDSSVCGETLRKWRGMGENLKLVDLRKAYLQLHVHPDLWRYQVVRFGGRKYCLTRLGFGLNVAPRIMTTVLRRVLQSDAEVAAGTDTYIDDIIVNENVVSAEKVIRLLEQHGLDAKPPEQMDGARVLGVRISRERGALRWYRGNVVVPVSEVSTKRQLFSWCGQTVGHFPVAAWLRPACSYLKRVSTSYGWDQVIPTDIRDMLAEVERRVERHDPVRGKWHVADATEATVWCDASSLALGAALEVAGDIVEDGCWLRKPSDFSHINLAELESVIKGVNLALSWGVRKLLIRTDSSTVHGWLRLMITGERRIRTHGLGASLARRRLGLIKDIIAEYNLKVRVELVRSADNKADELTRVPQSWLRGVTNQVCATAVEDTDRRALINKIHCTHHLGVDRTHYFVRRQRPDIDVSREEVNDVVRACPRCSSIDPAPVRWPIGSLDVDESWWRVAGDVTFFNGRKYLTLIDCGPSRFTIWKALATERAEEIAAHMETVFREHGPPRELLLDNSTSFRSSEFSARCKKWAVTLRYRCAYRSSGNGIVERVHRTIKRMAARSHADVLDMAFYYNMSPREGSDGDSLPVRKLCRYEWRCPLDAEPPTDAAEEIRHDYQVGHKVFVKPGHVRCTTEWPIGVVTGVSGNVQVEVNGVPRHVADVRRVPDGADQPAAVEPVNAETDGGVEWEHHEASGGNSDDSTSSGATEAMEVRTYPRRQSRLPSRFADYDMHNDGL